MPYEIDEETGEKIRMILPVDPDLADGFFNGEMCLNCRYVVLISQDKGKEVAYMCPDCNKSNFLNEDDQCPKCNGGTIEEDEGSVVWF